MSNHPLADNPLPPSSEEKATPNEDAMPLEVLKARVEMCPLRDCRGGDDDGYYIRDVRNNRHLCKHCAVPSPTGYIGRDTAKQMDDRYFQGTNRDYVIAFGVMASGSALANAGALLFGGFVGFFGLIIAFFVGNFAGTFFARQARRLTEKRVGRYSAEVSVAGIIAGMLLSPTLFALVRFGVFIIAPEVAFQLMTLVCTGVMAYMAWGIFKRRI